MGTLAALSLAVCCLPACCMSPGQVPLAKHTAAALLQGVVAADAPFVELIVSMAQEGAAAAAAEAAGETASLSSGAGSSSSSSGSKEGEEGQSSAGWANEGSEEDAGAAGSPVEGSEEGKASPFHYSPLVATCLLLRSMARSAYTTSRKEPAVGFLRRFVQLAGAGSEVAWFAQRLLHPMLLLLPKVLPGVPLVSAGMMGGSHWGMGRQNGVGRGARAFVLSEPVGQLAHYVSNAAVVNSGRLPPKLAG